MSVALSLIDVPKANYASSISSVGSSNSKGRRNFAPAAAAQVPLQKSNLGVTANPRTNTKATLREARSKKVLVSLWLLSASTFRRLGRLEDAAKSVEEAERVDSSNPDVWYQVRKKMKIISKSKKK